MNMMDFYFTPYIFMLFSVFSFRVQNRHILCLLLSFLVDHFSIATCKQESQVCKWNFSLFISMIFFCFTSYIFMFFLFFHLNIFMSQYHEIMKTYNVWWHNNENREKNRNHRTMISIFFSVFIIMSPNIICFHYYLMILRHKKGNSNLVKWDRRSDIWNMILRHKEGNRKLVKRDRRNEHYEHILERYWVKHALIFPFTKFCLHTYSCFYFRGFNL